MGIERIGSGGSVDPGPHWRREHLDFSPSSLSDSPSAHLDVNDFLLPSLPDSHSGHLDIGLPAVPERPVIEPRSRGPVQRPGLLNLHWSAASVESVQPVRSGLTPAIAESRTPVRPGTSVPRTLSAGSVEGRAVTVHQVRLGPKVQTIKVSRSAGVQVGDHNRQLNHYRFKIERPRMSLDRMLKGHPARLRSFERLVANPDSWMANYAFRRQLSAGPAQPGSRVLFAGASRAPTVRISARVDEYGATVVENSRGVQVADGSIQRNDFNYKLAGQEISLERMLHDRPDLARGLAMTVRHPDNPAVRRSFTRQVSNVHSQDSRPSLRILNRDWPSSGLSVEQGAGVQLGKGNSRTDRVSIDIRRLALTGWNSAERIAAKLDEPAPPRPSIREPAPVPSRAKPPVARQAPDISRSAPLRPSIPGPWDRGPRIGPF